MTTSKSLFIFYVANQERSARFYSEVLGSSPTLDVPGMTEFALTASSSLGLMPEANIKKLLGEALPDLAKANGIPRAELYLVVPDADKFHQRALAAGAKELSALALRSWGHRVAYSLDPDGHVIAFAEEVGESA